jgi:hypothetical protein
VGRHGLASSHYKNLINYAGDYYHRSVFLVANMMKDGVIDSFTKNTNVDGAWYDYDESKDPRWKGDAGKARKEFTKLQLAKEGKIDANGKMTTPYTSYELQNMKREANEAFEAQNTEDQENFRNGVQGLLFGNFKSWWLQKVKRYAMPGAVMTSAKNLTKTVDPKTGEIGYSYDGTYMEGIFYTLVNMGNYLKSAYDMKSFAGFKEWKESLTPHQVQNIRRVLGDLSLLGGSIALGAFMFNGNAKANKDNAWYYLWFQSSNEINTWSYLTATPIIGSGSAIPSLGIVANFVKNPLQTITKPGFTKAFSFFGDSK